MARIRRNRCAYCVSVAAAMPVIFLCGCMVDQTAYHTYVPKTGPDEDYYIVKHLIARERGQIQPLPEDAVLEFQAAIDEIRAIDPDSPQLSSLLARYEQLKTEWKAQPVDGAEWPKAFVDPVGMEYVLIPPGQFLMGSAHGSLDERPVHKVRISKPFYMGRYEVTQAQCLQVLGVRPRYFADNPSKPMVCVSWHDAQEFCAKISQQTHLEVTLPTEAQWEYACRAGGAGSYCFGDSPDSLVEYAYCGANWADTGPMPVGSKKPSGWGLHDMHGNVWEWCQDWYGPYPSDETTEPEGPGYGQYRVLRGGSWASTADGCRSASRLSLPPDRLFVHEGFRVVARIP